MANGRDDRALAAVNERRKGFFRPSIQKALGALVVVLVTTSVGLVFTLRDLARSNAELIEDHDAKAHAEYPVEFKEFASLKERFNIHEREGQHKHAAIDKALAQDHETLRRMEEFMRKGGRYTRTPRSAPRGTWRGSAP